MIKKYYQFITEMKKQHLGTDYKEGCIMVMLNITNWDSLISHFDENDLYHKDEARYGIESDPHITILYGIHPDKVDDKTIESIVKSVDGDDIKIDIDGVEVFENEKYDVVKMNVKSDYLTKLHYELSKLPNSDKFENYNPHITMAFVNKGEGQKYITNEYHYHIDGIHKVTYSKPDGKKIEWDI